MAEAQAQIRSRLAARLRECREEIEQELLARVYAIADPGEVGDPTYVGGLREALVAALDYGIEGIELCQSHAPPIPIRLLAQARLAARSRVSLDAVLRRYFAGYLLLSDFLVREFDRGALGDASLNTLLKSQATLFDRLVEAVSEEYRREEQPRPRSLEERRREQVQGLLEGHLLDTSDLPYRFEGRHLGAVAAGEGAVAALKAIGRALGNGTLLVSLGDKRVWAWFENPSPGFREELEGASSQWQKGLTLALGEPGEGLSGWRLTHRQAKAAASIAQHRPESFVLYGDVALLATATQDDVLNASLRKIFLAPIGAERDARDALLKTLRAYFDSDRNVSSAAAQLGVNRNTVHNRLGAIESLLGRPLSSCGAELELALRLEEMDRLGPQRHAATF